MIKKYLRALLCGTTEVENLNFEICGLIWYIKKFLFRACFIFILLLFYYIHIKNTLLIAFDCNTFYLLHMQ